MATPAENIRNEIQRNRRNHSLSYVLVSSGNVAAGANFLVGTGPSGGNGAVVEVALLRSPDAGSLYSNRKRGSRGGVGGPPDGGSEGVVEEVCASVPAWPCPLLD